ncbi:beta-mannosidase [Lutibacter sp. HS1-25]|uniref:glycoside hydrolase family 26 protein n=1 Tax=Lutibacter sp. HS1-25 TaxID=2485000 RepID=UPI00101259E6|nr:glycosyl hydrolase [Lutibacter sp. HS1-25]RXP52269.1 beta-mannosidase [Lutibacter sp. HS1-25]
MLKFTSKILLFIFSFILFYACSPTQPAQKKISLVDKKASTQVIELYKKLEAISKKGFAVGHQDATSYGLGWNYKNDTTKIQSDVKKVTGDFPAVFGFDLGWIEIGKEYNLDTVPFNLMKKLIIDAHKKGGIITISWHLNNPITEGNSWDKTPAVSSIIKGGSEREKYELWISRVADFLHSLKNNNEAIPVIFRPFHEMNGSWFWWGGENCNPKDYVTLWQETVELLRDKHNLHNILYAYSPNKLNPTDNYLTYYPGDDFVDILGIDIYDFNNAEDYIKSVKQDLEIVKKTAVEKNKLYAFTETGLESLKTENWFTKVLYPTIQNSGICWVLTWRNYDTKHHYMPYHKQLNETDFIEFEKLPNTLFLKDINSIN